MAKLPDNPLVSELFKAVHGKKDKGGKKELLSQYKRDDVKALLIWNFDKQIKSAIPEGEVPYKKNEAPINSGGHTRLVHEWRTLYNYIRGGNDTLSQMKRETMFIQLLESLHESEAELLMLVKDKKLQSKYRITRALVEEVFNDITWRDK
ncbi:MAG: hypothetical protein CMM43_00740 [Rhodospirillaceae bacterium]|nr:hypothetical protein [Rhodospirillaceae bacterium]